jgi:hypothetical protein
MMAGWTGLVYSIKYHEILWTGIKTKTIIQNSPAPTSDQSRDWFGNNVNGQVEIAGPLKVEVLWKTEKNEVTGAVQFRTLANEIVSMQFCSPYPFLKEGSIVNIRYSPQGSCQLFLMATVLSEDK